MGMQEVIVIMKNSPKKQKTEIKGHNFILRNSPLYWLNANSSTMNICNCHHSKWKFKFETEPTFW